MPETPLQEHLNTEFKETLEKHEEHLLIANREMGVMVERVSNIEKSLLSVDARTWYILTAIILSFLATLAIKILWK